MSLKQIIYNYLKSEYPRIIHKGEIGKKAILDWQYENENAGRRCRELVKEGKIEAIYNEKHEVQYRWKPIENYIGNQPFNPIPSQELKIPEPQKLL